MPRNEFQEQDHKKDKINGKSADEIRGMIQRGEITADDLQKVNGVLIWEGSELVDLSQEVVPLEETPEDEARHPSLADLRKEPGFATTKAHLQDVSDPPSD